MDTDQWVQVHQEHYDRESDGELATALAFAIAEAKGVDPLNHTEMPPLYEFIDAQALEETFFGPSGAGTRRTEAGAITFMYDNHKIALQSDGWISVYEPG
ncbi:HalOD1 output domain-containing protein [Halomicroarcula sp. GCM10025709]|uniref:HalOD1 output domain-containing protein n=1 Tax=Halomicroarcula sp. GCM10025709 TaxID=3252669 RepID=UPI0036187F56